MPLTKFHENHGKNIWLKEEGMVARRSQSFAHALTFSSQPLRNREIFLLEIEENERGWSGHLRIGLTQLDPSSKFPLPQYALPDLANMGRTWTMAVTKTKNGIAVPEDDETLAVDMDLPPPAKLLSPDGEYIKTSQGRLRKNVLQSSRKGKQDELLPTDVGSRIGVLFSENGNNRADMHFIINGEDGGCYARNIPFKNAPIYAVVDVYGTTKQVRIVQLNIGKAYTLFQSKINIL